MQVDIGKLSDRAAKFPHGPTDPGAGQDGRAVVEAESDGGVGHFPIESPSACAGKGGFIENGHLRYPE